VSNLRFGKGADVRLVDEADPLPVTLVGAASTGDGAVTDGVNAAIRASVLDYLNCKPVAVRLTDTNGDYVAPGGGAGGGLTDAQLRASPVPVDGSGVVQPISGTVAISGSVAVTGPLTDAQLRASAVPVSGTFFQATQPVSGTFWQATQPVSATSLPLPSGAATETTLAALLTLSGFQARIPVNGQGTMAGSVPVVIASNQSAVPVSGTFWQATQPVSGTFWQATQPVSGTFWPTTAAAPSSMRLSDGAAFYDAAKTGQLPAALVGARLDVNAGAWLGSTAPTVGQKTMASALPVSIASDQSAIAVTAPTLTKGTQGANGWSVQDLKDSGRVGKIWSATAVATVTSEALITLTPYSDFTSASTGTSFGVTSGKRLRIQQIVVTVRATSTVNVGGIVRLRGLPTGATLVGSPVLASIGCMSSNLATAVIGNALTGKIDFPDGFELSGSQTFGLTQLFSATTATIDVHIIGFEY
jgi:hypothetical protein